MLAASTAALALGPGAAPAAAQGNTCRQDVNPTYTDRCGPTFVLPSWGDAGGWTQPEQYETIQLADVDGDGDDELLARAPAGVVIQDFDRTLGQWRPQVTPVASPTDPTDIKQVPVVLTAFANPPPLSTSTPNAPQTDWTLPQYYDTIQAADIDDDKRAEILGRSADGLIEFKYDPATRTWSKLTDGSQSFSDSTGWGADPFRYATIQTGDVDGDGAAEVIARGSGGVVAVKWTGSAWVQLPDLSFLGDGDQGNKAQYWTSLQVANLTGDRRRAVVGRDQSGIGAFRRGSSGYTPLSRLVQTFSDHLESADCPFARDGTGTCFGSGAAYYKTIQFADVNGDGRDELIGRASDGLRVRRYQGDTPDAWEPLPTLTDLSDAGGYTAQKYWETIQAADINGDGREEVLARDKDGLNAWSYDPSNRAWTKLSPKTALALADDPWGSDRSYYSTIQTGDVDGDNRADVVARGPYGIRTWFYNRAGSSDGWARYSPGGYPDFPTRDCTTGETPPCGQRAAFNELNQRAQGSIPGGGQNVRDTWTGENAPSQSDLQNLEKLVTNIGDCTNGTGLPIKYASCTPPPGSSSFTAAEWTDVLNQILAEIFWAQRVWDHFFDGSTGLQEIWSRLLQEQLAQLPVIANDLKLAGPAQSTTEYSPGELWSAAFGIAGGISAFFHGPEVDVLVPLLWVASDLASLIPSATPELTDKFTAAYSDLQAKFANGISQADDAISDHSRLIRQDQALLTLVGQLRARGTWVPNADGIRAAGRQGFALWLYKTLLPTIWGRYVISSCQDDPPDNLRCAGPPAGNWMQGSGVNFTAIGPLPTTSNGLPATPCLEIIVFRHHEWRCGYTAPNADVATILWGQLSQDCAYDGQNPRTIWHFDGCSLGVDPRATLGDPSTVSASEAWAFQTFTGAPVVAAQGTLAGSVTQIGADDRATAARSATRGDGPVVRMRASVALRRGVRLRHARVLFDRLLFERRGAGELVRHRSGRRLPPLVLRRRSGTGGVFASRRRGAPRVGLRLRRRGQRVLSVRLVARNVGLPDPPTACGGTRPGVDLATRPITLHTRLRIDDGRRRPLVISLRPQWTCRRDRLGNVRRLVLQPPKYRAPTGRRPTIAVRGPRRVSSGRRATYRIVVRNRSRTTAYDVLVRASLPRALAPRRVRGARVRAGQVLWRWRALKPGRSRTVRLRVRAGRSATGRVCPEVVASAIDARSAKKRICTRIEQ